MKGLLRQVGAERGHTQLEVVKYARVSHGRKPPPPLGQKGWGGTSRTSESKYKGGKRPLNRSGGLQQWDTNNGR